MYEYLSKSLAKITLEWDLAALATMPLPLKTSANDILLLARLFLISVITLVILDRSERLLPR